MSDDKVIKLGAGTAWVWPLPQEGELVPDYPPQSFEVKNVTITTKPCHAVPCPPWSDDPPEVWDAYNTALDEAEVRFNEQYEREEREALEDK